MPRFFDLTLTGPARLFALVAIVLAGGLWQLPGSAQTPDAESQAPAGQCHPPGRIPDRGDLLRTGPLPMDIRSRTLDAPGRGKPMHFIGDVALTYGDQRLVTEELIYDPEAGTVRLPGWLRYTDAVVQMEAVGAHYDTRESSGHFEQVRYYVAGAEGAGHAARVEMLDSVTARVEQFDFTTCDLDDPDWQLKAGQVDLDFESGTGTARNARLEFKGVPILYSPWLSFPLDNRRKSGFLYPSLGSSSDTGLDISTPWYWNIAPNQDATFTPRWIAKRGAMLGSEYRFLTRRQAGQGNLDYLPDDDRADRDRYFGQLEYRARLAPRWSSAVNLARASDNRYFIDLGGELEDSAVQFLRSDARVTGHGRRWTFSTLVDTFQVLDESVGPGQEPYTRLPRVLFASDWPLAAGIGATLDSEAVYFDRSEGVTGARFDLLPEVYWRYVRPGWFVRPALGLRATAYALDNPSAGDDSPARMLPIASFDSGLIFERPAGGGRVQTLEPRLFYLYVPFREQQDLPRFDTSELTFGFARLFQPNRFTGPDRQGDANQLTLAVTTRLLDAADGASVLDASVGQIFFFADQRVQLPDQPADERSVSVIVGELNWRPSDRVLFNLGLQWDPEERETQVVGLGLRFRGRDQRQVAIGYRFRKDLVDQVDLRLRYPVFKNVNAISRFNYSFQESTALEVLGGIEYESCCWALNATIRQFIRDRDSEKRTTFFLELHLKGLGSLGRRPYRLFDN